MKEYNTNINWYPGHMEKAKRLMLKEYKNIDLVYELVDARIPRSSKIKNIFDIIGNKPKILIMTKKDLADPILLEKWILYYQNLGTKVIAADLNNNEDIKKIIALTHEMMQEIQQKRIEKGLKEKTAQVLVVGIPNVGKSTLINRLVGKNVVSTGNRPGITKNLTWLKTNHNILLLDTPGILWPKIENKDIACNLAAFSAIKSEILDVNEIGVHILEKLNRYYPQLLQARYGLTSTNMAINYDEWYTKIARNIGAMRGNEVDYEKVSNRLINDIKDGYIKGVTFDNEI